MLHDDHEREPVEARQVRGSPRELHLLWRWCGGRMTAGRRSANAPVLPVIRVPTLSGVVEAFPGDWIVRDAMGAFSVAPPGAYTDATLPHPHGKAAP